MIYEHENLALLLTPASLLLAARQIPRHHTRLSSLQRDLFLLVAAEAGHSVTRYATRLHRGVDEVS